MLYVLKNFCIITFVITTKHSKIIFLKYYFQVFNKKIYIGEHIFTSTNTDTNTDTDTHRDTHTSTNTNTNTNTT